MAIRIVEFSNGGIKLERFLSKNQHPQRKLLHFENWTSGEPQFLKLIISYSHYFWRQNWVLCHKMSGINTHIYFFYSFCATDLNFGTKNNGGMKYSTLKTVIFASCWGSPLVQFSKFNNFLWACWFLCKNLSNFVPLPWKLHNPYCHTLGQSKLMCQRENLSRVLYLPKMASSLKLFWVFQVCLHQSLTRSTVSFGTFIRNMYWLRRSKWNIYSSWADVAFAIISFTFPNKKDSNAARIKYLVRHFCRLFGVLRGQWSR